MSTIIEEKLAQIYSENKNDLLNFAKKIMKNDLNAEDSVHETFARLCRHDFEDLNVIKPWLYTVCRNFSFQQLAKFKKISYQRNEDLQNESISEDASPCEDLLLKESKEKMKKSFSILNKRQKQAIKLRYYSDLSYAEIAKKMKTTVGNVGFILSTSIEKLRKEMKNNLDRI